MSELVFQSDFEGDTRVVIDNARSDHGAPYEYIAGTGTLPEKSSWDADWAPFLRGGRMDIQYTGGKPSQRFAQIIPEPGNPSNKVLHFWLNDAWQADGNATKARIQANIYSIREGLKEFYQSVRVFLTDDFNELKTYPRKITWCTISEFWNNEWWVKDEPYGFRISLGIGKPVNGPGELHFILEAQDPGMKPVWNADDHDIPVPIGTWFTMDYYFKEGNGDTGRFWMAITPDGGHRQVVFDKTGYTHCTKDPNPDGLTGYNPMKLYTSKELIAYVRSQGKTLQIYWDDFKLWKNKRP
ncbi:MAG: hypothetical protein HZC28_00625 [Spirochaetes bacterium]|nr:hypothetical protein [Spirochaetota bacterium]